MLTTRKVTMHFNRFVLNKRTRYIYCSCQKSSLATNEMDIFSTKTRIITTPAVPSRRIRSTDNTAISTFPTAILMADYFSRLSTHRDFSLVFTSVNLPHPKPVPAHRTPSFFLKINVNFSRTSKTRLTKHNK